MLKLEFSDYTIVAAELGEENCLPDILNNDYIHASITMTDKIMPEEKKHIGKGMINTLLPYQIQDNYNRIRKEKQFKAAILENDYMKAVFLPELGGRLWSLYNKVEKRELLFKNPIFQPCNLALRNAWFSGGVEWNIGIKGHNPLTCSPMFAKKCINKCGEPVLKMYEYERIRDVVYCIYATLKKDCLMIKVKIENTSDNDTYMYWWSNISIPEQEGTRVIVPAKEAFVSSYHEGTYLLDKDDVPYSDGADFSYPLNYKQSKDIFYKIAPEEKKWIAAVAKDAKGLLQFSTDELIGRKMFVWGQGQGGKHWNSWLSGGNEAYIEIQAGLMHTQLEHFIMQSNSSLEWTEGYTMLSAPTEQAHSSNWETAQNCVENKLNDVYCYLNEKEMFEISSEEKTECFGSGWGALENIVRSETGKKPISASCEFTFDGSEGLQQEWIDLIRKGELKEKPVCDVIKSYLVSGFWLNILEQSIKKGESAHWYGYMHLGVMQYAKGNIKCAVEAFNKSVECRENPWALQNLAQIEQKIYKNNEKAVKLILHAVELKSDYRPLLTQCAEILFKAGKYQQWIDIYESMTDSLKQNGRLKLLKSMCLVRLGHYMDALAILSKSFIMEDIKEGEFSVSHLWIDIHRGILNDRGIMNISDEDVLKKYPLPKNLDFRMHE